MYSFADIYVGWTADGQVILGIVDTKATISLNSSKRLISMLRLVNRRIQRSAWKQPDED